jgi:hypothetical protein
MDIPKDLIDKIASTERSSNRLPNDLFEPLRIPRSTTATYIDGGSGVVMATPSYLVALVRVYAVTYKDVQKLSAQKKSCFVHLAKQGTTILATFYGTQKPPISFDSEIESAVDIIRKVLELELARGLITHEGLIVLDGDLEAEEPMEAKAFELLHETAKNANAQIVALSKTNRFISKGEATVALLMRSGPREPWLYRHNQKTSFVKLNTRSKYVFRLDSISNHRDIAASLLAQSADPVFLGYPYALVEADKRARVTFQEVRQAKLLIDARVKKSSDLALDAHSVLDRLNQG